MSLMKETQAPTRKDIAKLEANLCRLRETLAEEEAALTVAEQRTTAAYRSGEGDPAPHVEAAAASEKRIVGIRRAIGELEGQLAVDSAVVVRAEATERLVRAIPRACGSLYNEYLQDVERVKASLRAVADDLGRLSDRGHSLTLYRLEAEQVAARFGLPMPELPRDLPLVHLDELMAAIGQAQAVGLRDRQHLSDRERRRLIADTVGGKLIAEAGPTDQERQEAEDAARKEAERKSSDAAEMARFAPLMKEAEALKVLPVSRF